MLQCLLTFYTSNQTPLRWVVLSSGSSCFRRFVVWSGYSVVLFVFCGWCAWFDVCAMLFCCCHMYAELGPHLQLYWGGIVSVWLLLGHTCKLATSLMCYLCVFTVAIVTWSLLIIVANVVKSNLQVWTLQETCSRGNNASPILWSLPLLTESLFWLVRSHMLNCFFCDVSVWECGQGT
jgi:hypothetical protein